MVLRVSEWQCKPLCHTPSVRRSSTCSVSSANLFREQWEKKKINVYKLSQTLAKQRLQSWQCLPRACWSAEHDAPAQDCWPRTIQTTAFLHPAMQPAMVGNTQAMFIVSALQGFSHFVSACSACSSTRRCSACCTLPISLNRRKGQVLFPQYPLKLKRPKTNASKSS